MPQYQKKRHISKRTATTRLFTDDEREVQRRATNEGKERSEIIRQAVSNAFRTERLALARKDETMQPVIDTYRKMIEDTTGGLRNQLIRVNNLLEELRDMLRRQFPPMNENLETIACAARYNTEQAIVIRALMQLYIFNVYQQLEMQCGLDPALTEEALRERVGEFRWNAGNEMARIMEDSADGKNQTTAEQLIARLYRNLCAPLPMPSDTELPF
jgi:hypothetical protein